MTPSTDDPPDETNNDPAIDFDAMPLGAPVTSPYKVLGHFSEATGVGVLGQNDATSGTPIGVEGAVPGTENGYGLFTSDDGRIEGTLATTSGHEVTVDGHRAARLGPVASDFNGDQAGGNVLLGFEENTVGDGVIGATVGGGGKAGTHTVNSTSRDNHHLVTGEYGTIAGGYNNRASGLSSVGGGRWNTADGTKCTIGGGQGNTSGGESFYNFATVAGGTGNTAGNTHATVGGGSTNDATGESTTIAGGFHNSATTAYATVGGGHDSEASGTYATVPGGRENVADASHSLAAGRLADTAGNDGAFVWGDGSSKTVTAGASDQVVFQAGGGLVVYTDSDTSTNTGATLPANSGSWTSLSSAAAKSDVSSVDPERVLDGVASLSIGTWRYDGEAEAVRHMGPMAEEFHETFDLGSDDRRIASIDADGVAFAAIQGLRVRLAEKDSRIAEQSDRIDDLEAANKRLADRTSELEAANRRLVDRLASIEDRLESRDGGDGDECD